MKAKYRYPFAPVFRAGSVSAGRGTVQVAPPSAADQCRQRHGYLLPPGGGGGDGDGGRRRRRHGLGVGVPAAAEAHLLTHEAATHLNKPSPDGARVN